ncbi:MAG: HD domain-containing protein [Oscillospiraceae bacterium]|nr:HD domain-containing protein [Oscillospiraceae bacterium]
MDAELGARLGFLVEIDKMKGIRRQTLLADRSREETDAEHSWHFAVMALTLFGYCALEGVDIGRVLRMALVHDLVEVYAGDTFAYDAKGAVGKEAREAEAADRLFSLLPDGQAAEFRGIWEEFDRMGTPDAVYASAIDRLQPFLNNSVTEGHTWARHGVTDRQVYARMDPVRVALPGVWGFVVDVVREGLEKGWITPADGGFRGAGGPGADSGAGSGAGG